MRLEMNLSRRRLVLAILLLAGLALYWAWGVLTRSQGSQRVTFVPAFAECASEGTLRYCVYRDRAGTNGDIVYHLHGRNLDEQIWNGDTYYTALVQAEWQQRGVRRLSLQTINLDWSAWARRCARFASCKWPIKG